MMFKNLLPFLFFAIASTGCQHLLVEQCRQEYAVTIEQVISSGDTLLVGERHGTVEMPAYFQNLVKVVAERRAPVLVALEFSEKWQPFFDEPFSDTNKLPSNFDEIATVDGRSTKSMIQMINNIKRLRDLGHDITLRAVDPGSLRQLTEVELDSVDHLIWLPENVDIMRSTRDIRMAINTKRSCEDVGCEFILYYAGDVHTRKAITNSATMNIKTGERTSFALATSGYILSRFADVTSLQLVHEGGVMKVTNADGVSRVFNVKPNVPPYVTGANTPFCTTTENREVDYVINLGDITKSPTP